MSQKKSVEIVVAQQKLTLRTDGDPSHVKRVADLVNKKLTDVLPYGQPVSHQVLILAAMNLADELIQVLDAHQEFKGQVEEKSRQILTRLDKEFPLA